MPWPFSGGGAPEPPPIRTLRSKSQEDLLAPEPPAKKAKKASAASDSDPNKPTTDKYKVVVKNLADGKTKEQPVADPTFAQMKDALKAKSVKHDWPNQQLEGKCSDANITFMLNEAGKAKFKEDRDKKKQEKKDKAKKVREAEAKVKTATTARDKAQKALDACNITFDKASKAFKEQKKAFEDKYGAGSAAAANEDDDDE